VSELVVEVFEGGVSTGSLESCHCWQTVFVEANPDFLSKKPAAVVAGTRHTIYPDDDEKENTSAQTQ
jgi:hypothetical protein